MWFTVIAVIDRTFLLRLNVPKYFIYSIESSQIPSKGGGMISPENGAKLQREFVSRVSTEWVETRSQIQTGSESCALSHQDYQAWKHCSICFELQSLSIFIHFPQVIFQRSVLFSGNCFSLNRSLEDEAGEQRSLGGKALSVCGCQMGEWAVSSQCLRGERTHFRGTR